MKKNIDIKKKFTKDQIRKEIKPEEVAAEKECAIREVNDVKEAARLQKEGWVVVEILSAQFGVRPKTWRFKHG